MTDPDDKSYTSDPAEAAGSPTSIHVPGIDDAAEGFWLRESQRVARIGTYRFDVASDAWHSTQVMDDIFGIDGSHPKTAAGWLAIVHPEHRDEMARYLQEHVLGSGKRFDRTYRIQRPSDRQERWVHGLGELVTDEGSGQTSLIGTIQDITERVEAEEELRESHALLTSVMSAASEAIFVKGLDGAYTFVNDAVCRALDKGRDEILGSVASDLFNATEAEEIAATDRIVTDSGEPLTYDERVTLADGRKHIFLSTKGPLRDAGGHITGLFGVSHDVTRGREAEAALRESASRLAEAQQIAHLGSWVADVATQTTVWSDEACRIYGVEPSPEPRSIEEVGAPIHPEDRHILSRWIEAILAGGTPPGVELRVIRPDGEYVVHGDGKAVFDDDGRPVRVVGTVRDVTDWHRAQTAIRAEEAKFRALFESAADAIVVVGPDHVIRMANPRADVQFGYPPGELVGQPLSVLIPEGVVDVHADLTAAFLVDPRQRPMGLGLSLNAVRGDGSVFPAEISLSYVDTDEGVMTMATIIDITERKRAEEALLAQEAEHRANVAKTEFLSRMSHELRTPLTALLGFAQLLEMEQLGTPNDESVTQILNAGHLLLELVDDVLDISKIEASSLGGTSRPVSVIESVGAAANLMTPAASEHGVSLEVDLDAIPKVSVSADPRRLRQGLLNILSNAIKYNHPGGTVTVGAREEGGRVLIEVADTGVGISPENLVRIWEPFSRVTDDEHYVQGHGLGLSVTRTLIEAMGGRVDVTSEVGRGTSFTVDLPRAPDPSEAGREGDDGAASEPTRVILYVEDNRDNVRLVERVLGLRPRLQLVVAPTGEEGLSLADERLPSVILLDLTLPDINGYECLRRLKESEATRDIPVVIISGVSDADTIARVKSAGAASYLTKPLDVHQLLDLLDELAMIRPSQDPGG